MKAISPSTPAPPASAALRSDRSSDASAADEAFGALIAAAIGAAPRPVVPNEAPPKQAAPSAAGVTASPSHDNKTSTADGDQPVAPGADRAPTAAKDAQQVASSGAPTVETPKRAAVPAGDGDKPTALPVVPGATAVAAKGAPDAAPSKTAPGVVPGGLETAAAALAQALTAGAPAQPANPSAPLDALPVDGSASPLLQGQLPAQLVKLSTASAPAAAPAKPTDKPATTAATAATGATVATAAPAAPAAPVVGPVPAPITATAHATAATAATAANAAQVAPAATDSPTDLQHATGKGDGQHSSSATNAVPPVTSDAKATPASFDQSLQMPTSVANAAVPVPTPLQQPIAAAVPPATQAVVAPPAAQIVQVVAPLRTAKDGDYTLSLQLHPAELGPVTVRVDVHQGVLSVHMVADNAQGHDALNQSLNDLRSQLEAGGVRTGDIGLGSRSSGQQLAQQQDQQQGAHHQAADTSGGRDGSTDRRPVNSRLERVAMSSSDAALDVRI